MAVESTSETGAQDGRAKAAPGLNDRIRGFLQPTGGRAPGRVETFFAKFGVLLAFVAVIVLFSVLRPDSFPTWGNVRSILNIAAPLVVMATVLTVPMIMWDFDLSVANNVQLMGAVAVVLMSTAAWSTVAVVPMTLLLGAMVGLILGLIIAYSKVSAFVITLGAGILMLGIELDITNSTTVFEGLNKSYLDIADIKLLGLNLPIWIALVVAIILWFVTRHTVLGRHMHAIGGNKEAARLSGVNVELVRTAGFVIVGIGAAIAGIIITSAAASAFPNAASGNLLPAYAAVFLGAAMLKPGQFHIWGTVIGVLFMGTIQTGLTLMNYPASTTNIVTGLVFIVAVLLSRIGARAQA